MGENDVEGAKAESQIITINRTISLEEKIRNSNVKLGGGLNVKDLSRLDTALGPKDDWDLIQVNMGRGRLFPRGEFNPDEMASSYKYGNELQAGERGLTPIELLSMSRDGLFGGLRGVFIPGLKKGELLRLNLEDSESPKLEKCPLPDVPNHSIRENYAFPTVKTSVI